MDAGSKSESADVMLLVHGSKIELVVQGVEAGRTHSHDIASTCVTACPCVTLAVGLNQQE